MGKKEGGPLEHSFYPKDGDALLDLNQQAFITLTLVPRSVQAGYRLRLATGRIDRLRLQAQAGYRTGGSGAFPQVWILSTIRSEFKK